MVNVTSITGNGLKDWLIQRATAMYLIFYSVCFAVMWITQTPFDYAKWHALFQTPWFQVGTALALFAIVFHAWIGVWTVTTDYIKNTTIRLSIQGFVAFLLLSQLIGGFMTIWGK